MYNDGPPDNFGPYVGLAHDGGPGARAYIPRRSLHAKSLRLYQSSVSIKTLRVIIAMMALTSILFSWKLFYEHLMITHKL